MAVRTRDEIVGALRTRIGEDTSDEAISLDASWRKKYMDRFSGKTGEEVKEEQEEQIKDDSEPRTFDELFTEREG